MTKDKLKKIFSRLPLIALTIILLFLFDVTVFFGFFFLVRELIISIFPQSKFVVLLVTAIVDWLIVLSTVLHVANRDMVPEAKIPWLICVLGLNLLGVAIYAVFSHNNLSRRQRRRLMSMYEQSYENALPLYSKEEVRAQLGNWAGVSEALSTASRAAVLYGGTKTQYFPSGEAFAETYLRDLETAQKYIFLEYFIVAKGKFLSAVLEVLERKVKEGVEVRMLYDDIGSMARVSVNFARKLQKRGIKCVKFNPFVPVVSEMHNNRDHRKITVIDGIIGYTGGLNFADEYINLTHPYGYWKDTAVRLEGAGVRSLTLMFLQLYNVRQKEIEDFSPFLPKEYEFFEDEGFVQPYGDGPRPFYRRALGEDVYINILNGAREYVYIATPYLIIDYRLREALVLAAQRGVDVRILMPGIPDKKLVFALSRSNYLALIRGGVKIYSYTGGFVHAKSFVADDTLAVVGTINLDYRSFLFHFEDAVLMYRAKAVAQLKQDMDECFALSEEVTEEKAKKNAVTRGFYEVLKIFAPLF